MLKRLDLDLDLQTRSKATRQKWRLVELIEKTPITAIVKGEEGRFRSKFISSLFLEKASFVFFSLATPETCTFRDLS